jgi:uncharacterized protein YfaS (alpha-2-macroglobulin family)
MLVGEARFYFGLPVTAGQVRWRVTRVPVFPPWWGYWRHAVHGRGQSARVVAAGETALEADGTFKVNFTPEADERTRVDEPDVSYRYEVAADVTDEGGETRSASRSIRLGWVSVEARLEVPDDVKFGAAFKATVHRSDLSGAPRAGAGTYQVVELAQPAQPVLPADEPAFPLAAMKKAAGVVTDGDRLQPRWQWSYSAEATLRGWTDGVTVARGSLKHGADGEAVVEASALRPGAYRLRYETVDDFGVTSKAAKDFVVGSASSRVALPLVLLSEKSSVKVGERVRFFIHSGFDGQPVTVEVFHGGKRTQHRFLSAGRDSSILEVQVAEKDRGGFTVVATTLKDFQLLSASANVFVPWDDRELSLEIGTFRDTLRPGSKETWRLTVKGPGGRPLEAAAELLAYMYDRSLDAFAPHGPPSVMSLYSWRIGGNSYTASLGAAHQMWVVDRSPQLPPYPTLNPDVLKFYDSYGLGGMGRLGFGGVGKGGGGHMPRRRSAGFAAEEPVPEGMADRSEMKKEMRGDALASAVAPASAPSAPPPPAAAEPTAAARGDGQPAPELRSNFSETAFWRPHLVSGADGSATIEFTVPDSVTSWNVWIHGLTKDLRGGSLSKTTRTVKELMVRPYLPRFLREGDTATLKVVVNNAAKKTLSGKLSFDVIDPETQRSVASELGLKPLGEQSFTVEPSKGATLSFEVTAPRRVGQVAVKVVATAGNLSDGELRPLPLLPSRVRLAQSRFVTLKGKDTRTMSFPDLAKKDDATRVDEQLVVTVDAQLFYSVIDSLPYLIRYPYECTEQTLNRFLSTGIVSSVYERYPTVAKMAKDLSKRETVLETFDQVDANRKLLLEESPWLNESKGGRTPGSSEGVINVLDPRVAKAEQEGALAKLKKSQTSLGGFPWWPGGPPSPYMTLYLAHGFAKASEFKVDVPKDMVQRAWAYLARHYREEMLRLMREKNCCFEHLTFLNYVASSYPDATWTGDALTLDERKEILEFSFKHWKKHSPYLKGLLALTLKRMGRPKDADLVFDSVMDSAKTTPDEGTFWAQEDRSWLWYNDTIETHAFALRTLMELEPKDPRKDGLVHWLFLNKKLNHWKSTRATAEVIYSLVKYLEQEQTLGVREDSTVSIGAKKTSFVFEPEKYTGKKNQVVVAGSEIDPRTMSTVTVSKDGKGFQFASATWHFSTEKLPTEERGDLFHVARRYFKRERVGKEAVLKPLAEGATLSAGDELEVQLSLKTRHAAEYVHLRDPRGAGFEPESATSRYKWDLGIGWYEEIRDSATNFFFEALPAGEYTFKYRLRTATSGTFRVGPATVQSMYAPEFTAYSTGTVLNVTGPK